MHLGLCKGWLAPQRAPSTFWRQHLQSAQRPTPVSGAVTCCELRRRSKISFWEPGALYSVRQPGHRLPQSVFSFSWQNRQTWYLQGAGGAAGRTCPLEPPHRSFASPGMKQPLGQRLVCTASKHGCSDAKWHRSASTTSWESLGRA